MARADSSPLYLNDKRVGEDRVDKTEYGRFSADETFDTGLDPASPVSEDYQSHFRFPGTIDTVEIDIAPANLAANDQRGSSSHNYATAWERVIGIS